MTLWTSRPTPRSRRVSPTNVSDTFVNGLSAQDAPRESCQDKKGWMGVSGFEELDRRLDEEKSHAHFQSTTARPVSSTTSLSAVSASSATRSSTADTSRSASTSVSSTSATRSAARSSLTESSRTPRRRRRPWRRESVFCSSVCLRSLGKPGWSASRVTPPRPSLPSHVSYDYVKVRTEADWQTRRPSRVFARWFRFCGFVR